MKILCVEDHPGMREAIVDYLSTAGSEVHAVKNGQEAIDYLTQNQPDLVITDFDMPVMDGMELIKRAKESGYQGQIFMFTADDTVKEEVEALGARFFDKAYPRELMNVVNNLLGELVQ